VSGDAAAALDEARGALAAAQALWREGLVSEADTYMTGALRATLRAWASATPAAEPVESAEGADATLASLERAGYRDADRLRAVLAGSGGAKADVDRAWAEVERLFQFVSRRLTPPRARRRARLRAGVTAGALALIVVVVAVRIWTRPLVRASGLFAPETPAAYAVDGIESTEWLLPDRAPGWLEITFRWPRRVSGVRLLNSHNRHYLDRGAQRVRVTAFSNAGAVASAEGSFRPVTPDRSALDLPLAAQGVTHVRVEILSFFGRGGGLAEVEIR
jgi:hypothetical protein